MTDTNHDDFAATWSPAEGATMLERCEGCGSLVPADELTDVREPTSGTLASPAPPTYAAVCPSCL